jgi:hypothetical protein
VNPRDQFDLYPPPPGPELTFLFFDPRPVGYPGDTFSLFSFAPLGGPAPAYFSQGLLHIGSNSIKASLVSNYGPRTLFLISDSPPKEWEDDVLTEKENPRSNSFSSGAIFEPQNVTEEDWVNKNKSEFSNIKPVLAGWELFADPERGWIMSLVQALGGGKGPWPKELWPTLDLELLQGINFIWALPSIQSSITLSILSKSAEDKTLLIYGRDDLIESWANLNQFNQALALAPKLGLNPKLDDLTLEAKISSLNLKRRDMAQKDREAREVNLKLEEGLKDNLALFGRLHALKRSLDLLRVEAESRRNDWALWEKNHTEASLEWSKFGPPASGLKSLFGKEKRLQREKLAQEKLEAAEKAMRSARLEIESLLKEARIVEADLQETSIRIKNLPEKEFLEKELLALREENLRLTASAASLELKPPIDRQEREIMEVSRIVARPWGLKSPLEDDLSFDHLIVVAPPVKNQKGREALSELIKVAKKRLTVVADFSSWSWIAASPEREGQTGWKNFLASEILVDSPLPPTSFLGPLPNLKDPLGGQWLRPEPSRYPWLKELNLTSGLAQLPVVRPLSPTLRAYGESGPSSPASALTSFRLAAEAARLAQSGGDNGALIYILTPSPSQTALIRALIEDLNFVGRVFVGQPQDFELWPRSALTVLDTALGPPMRDHPWVNPQIGRPAILRALALTSGALAVCARPESLETLNQASPLVKLWKALECSLYPSYAPNEKVPFWDALNKAKESFFAVMPPFEPSWWTPMASHFFSALRRKVKTIILACLPDEEKREYPGTVIRDLRRHGANVVLAKGFNDFLTTIDGYHLSLGTIYGAEPKRPTTSAYELPKTCQEIGRLFRLTLINEKLGPGSWRNCSLCGWPLTLINSEKTRHFGDTESLKLGCLNLGCLNHKKPRRLDERWPFSRVPLCPLEPGLSYEVTKVGRINYWSCPKHPDQCPSYRVIPGDCPVKG